MVRSRSAQKGGMTARVLRAFIEIYITGEHTIKGSVLKYNYERHRNQLVGLGNRQICAQH